MTPDAEQLTDQQVLDILGHYDVGAIRSIEAFTRGSRKSPKRIVTTDQGRYLLKRRAHGKDDPLKVAFCHGIQNHLAVHGFPLPRLIGTTDDNNSMLQIDGRVYELFEFVTGKDYDGSLRATHGAGCILAQYHVALRDYQPHWTPPRGCYHDSDLVRKGLNAIPTRLSGHDSVSGHQAELLATIQKLRDIYDTAAQVAVELGVDQWHRQIVHNDYHPGNALFAKRSVVAVLDFDAARILPRVTDVANGMLQFSIIGGQHPADWPDFFDESRMKRFLRGYDDTDTLSAAELQACPHLMIEALIAEAVVPIAATGSFGHVAGWGFLQMVHRKSTWIQTNVDRLGRLLDG